MRGWTGALALLLSITLAHAQPTPQNGSAASEAISPAELRYSVELADHLDLLNGGVERIEHRFEEGNPPRTTGIARGVRVRLTPGLEVDRLLLHDVQAAFEYALRGTERGPANQLIEARGREVVVVRGLDLGDARQVRMLLRAVWDDSLRAPRGKRSLFSVRLRDRGKLLVLHRHDPLVSGKLERSVRNLQARYEQRDPAVHCGEAGREYGFEHTGGTNGAIRASKALSFFLSAVGKTERRVLNNHFYLALETGSWRRPRTGALGRLRGLFD